MPLIDVLEENKNNQQVARIEAATASVTCLQWWKQLDIWKHIVCHMPLPKTLPWALKSKSCGNMVLQQELSQTTGLLSKTTS